jgi:hypothetical protein
MAIASSFIGRLVAARRLQAAYNARKTRPTAGVTSDYWFDAIPLLDHFRRCRRARHAVPTRSPTEDQGTLAVRGTDDVQGVTPDTVFSVQRLLDPVPDSDCADPGPPPLTLTTFESSPGGAGAGSFDVHTPAPSGSGFDVRFRITDGAGTVLESDCLTVTVK